MKKMALMFMFVVCVCCYAQISTITPVQKQAPVKVIPTSYPVSEANITENVNLFKGQELVVKPLRKDNGRYNDWDSGYEGFRTMKFNVKKHKKYQYIYGQPDKMTGHNTLASELENKVFIVEEVESVNGSYNVQGGRFSSGVLPDTCILILREKDNPKNKCKFVYSYGFGGFGDKGFPFVVMSHYNYLKEKCVGKQYKFDNQCLYDKDINTGKRLYSTYLKTWTCIDVIMSPYGGNLTMLLEADSIHTYILGGQTINPIIEDLVRIEESTHRTKTFRINAMSIEKWNRKVKQYGTEVMNAVLKHEIIEGMPYDALQMSWGYPDKINSSSYGKQLVYEIGRTRKYVYIEKGVVTSWN